MEHANATRPAQMIGYIDSSTELSSSVTKTIPETSIFVQPNCEPFDCPICLQRFEIGEGIILMDCLHEFCRNCIVATIHQNKDFIQVDCPFNQDYKCDSVLSEREVRGLITVDQYNQFIQNNQRAALAIHDQSINEPPRKSFKINVGDELVESQNSEFHCPRCARTFEIQNGINLKSCNHAICKECIIDHFFKTQKSQMKCEFQADDHSVCGKGIDESEVRSVLNEVGLVEPIVRINIFLKKYCFQLQSFTGADQCRGGTPCQYNENFNTKRCQFLVWNMQFGLSNW